MRIREKPSLRLSIDAQTPSGKHFRWAEDESRPENVLADLRFSSTMPGGFESLDTKLPRKSAEQAPDLDRLTTLRVLGPGCDVAWEGRLERTPRVSGTEVSISPSAVGWQAALADDTSARAIYRDIDQSKWSGPSVARKLDQFSRAIQDPSANPDPISGVPVLSIGWDGVWTTAQRPQAEAWYDAGAGGLIGSVYFSAKTGVNITSATLGFRAFLSDDDLGTNIDSGTLHNPGTAGATFTETLASTGDKRFALLMQLWNAATAGGLDGARYEHFAGPVAVYGDHGLTLRGDEPTAGFYASDVIAHAVRTWAPLLNFTEGSDGTISPSGFVIEQLAFLDPTTAADIITQANRFHLNDWAVWEGPTFWYHERGARGRKWRARVAPAQLSETGPQIDRLWNSVIVSYNDVDGTTKTVGPVGSGADTEDDSLKDADPDNPLNELGITRRSPLSMGVSTAAGATEVGRRFLEEQKLLDTSGQATLVGHVTDDRGVVHPAWRVRAGDYISFVDSNSTGYRRVTRADYTHSSRSCSVDLDSPPEGLAALLSRLDATLAPLGLGQ